MEQSVFVAPDGYVVNLHNPQRIGQAANLYASCIGMVLATLLLGIRMHTKIAPAKRFSTEDGTALIAWALSIVIQVITLFQFSRGTLGIHIWDIPAKRISSTVTLIKICTILYCPFLAAAKISLLFFYARLSRLRWFRVAVFGSMFLVVASNIGLVFPLIFTCTPVSRNHDSCLDPAPTQKASSALDVATNVVLLTLSLPIVATWTISRLQKAGLAFLFIVGTATCIASIIRLAATYPMLASTDQTWAIATPSLWALIEVNLILVAITLPTLHCLLPFHTSSRPRSSGVFSGSRTHPAPSCLPAIELTPTHSTFQNRKRYSRMTASSASASISISSAELTSWKTDVGSRASVVTMPSPVLDRILSRKSVGTIVKTRTTTVTSEVVAGLGVSVEGDKRGSWTPPF